MYFSPVQGPFDPDFTFRVKLKEADHRPKGRSSEMSKKVQAF